MPGQSCKLVGKILGHGFTTRICSLSFLIDTGLLKKGLIGIEIHYFRKTG
jgi:hypothetical protein